MNVTSFYRFVDVREPAELAADLEARCARAGLLGTILVAREGVNGTLSGRADAIQGILERLRAVLGLESPIDARWTEAREPPFRRLRVRLKNEIVALGRADIRPQRRTGRHVAPQEWNGLLDDPETLVIDTRNRYEIELGTFPGAVDPGTDSFREFADFVRRLPKSDRRRPVAMFCTGGIRCEKASAFMLEMGFENVAQLQGGVLNYLQQIDTEENRWTGECFVFDSRVAVDRDLAEGGYVQCHACRRPLTSDDIESPAYVRGESCPHCS